MADEEGKETAPKGNEWEVVSLTASAYAAAPGPEQVDSSQGSLDAKHEAETSNAMFMSGHFVFPPSQHENLPLEPEYKEIQSEKGSVDDITQLVKGEGFKSDEFPGISVFDDKVNSVSVGGADLGKDAAAFAENVQSIYSTAEFSSFHSETTMSRSNMIEDDEGTDESIENLDSAFDSGLPDVQQPDEGDEYDGVGLPCEAWWKRQAFSLYAHAKETNTFWSVFIAAAVMGLVIIGHQWQQERWKVLHLKWQFGINDERMSRMLGPISRFKDVIVGGHRRGSLIRGSTSAER